MHNGHSLVSTGVKSATIRAKIHEIAGRCLSVQNHPNSMDFWQISEIGAPENLIHKLMLVEEKIRAKAEEKIVRVKQELAKMCAGVKETKQKILAGIEQTNYSDIQLIREEANINQQIVALDAQFNNISIEDLEAGIDGLQYETHRFCIPRGTSFSEEHEMYEAKFSITVTNDLIGLFKSFNICMESSEFGTMIFEYDIFLVTGNFSSV